MSSKLEVKQVKSSIGKKPRQRATLRALGLRRVDAVRVHEDTPVIRGMIEKVKHLVRVEKIKK